MDSNWHISNLVFLGLLILLSGCGEKETNNKKSGEDKFVAKYFNPSEGDDAKIIESITADSGYNIINLSNCDNLTDKSIHHIAKMLPEIREFQVDSSEITDEGLASIGDMANLEKLWIEGEKVTNEGVSHLKNLSNLKELVLYRTNGITDEGVAHLSTLGALEQLKILYGDSRIDGPGLESLGQMKNLKTFACRKLSNDSLKYLGTLHQLEELDLSECRDIDNDGIQHLSKLANLKLLSISFSNVTDEGLVHLRELKSLEKLFTTSTEITEQGIQELQTHLPKLKTW